MELPVCKHREQLSEDLMVCRSPCMVGPPEERFACDVQHCLRCALADRDCLPHVPPSEARKPRVPKGRMLSFVNERRSRCQELKAAGLPCPDDPASAVARPSSNGTAVVTAPADLVKPIEQKRPLTWMVGVTTVPER